MMKPEWLAQLKQYQGADAKKSITQIVSSFIPYLAFMALMLLIMSNGYPYWIVLLLAIVAGCFLVRIFIILHDCSHNSFFRSSRTCSVLGHICGVFTFTAFSDWQRSHGIHHATVSNLEKRGIGDVWTMTVDEYRSASKWKRLVYRAFRNPLVIFVLGPVILFLLLNRIPSKSARKREILSTIFTNTIIALIIIAAYFTIGIENYIGVQFPVTFISGVMGVWLFFVQHQFENVYWSHNEEWDSLKAAIEGSSFYKLPGLFRWISGSIGYHHVHHLRPAVPNYNLKKCYHDIPELQEVTPITIFKGFKSLFLHLWDEKTGKLVSFSTAKKNLKPLSA